MSQPRSLTYALLNSWDRIAPDVHAGLRKQVLTDEEVKQALRDALDQQRPPTRAARRYWLPLTDAEKRDALDKAIPPGPHWLADEDGNPLPKPDGWE